jgi:predicted transcriptional regulator
MKIRNVMTTNPLTINPDNSTKEVAALFLEHGIEQFRQTQGKDHYQPQR